MKEAKKWGAGEDCFLYGIDDKIVWNFDGSEKSKAELAEAKATYIAVLKEEDKKEGRFFEDQPDVNDDYQIHINFIIAKDGKDTSSFNYTGFYAKDINKPLHEYGMIEQLLKETEEQIKTFPIKDKFIGDIIVTPDCIGGFDFYLMCDIKLSRWTIKRAV